MTNEEVVKLLSDPKVIMELKKLETEEEIVTYLKEKNLDISLEKAQKIKQALCISDDYKGKLSDEQLDDIAGGGTAGKIMAGIVLGAAAVGILAGGGKFAYDVINEANQSESLRGAAKGFLGDVAGRSLYQQAVHKTADLLK